MIGAIRHHVILSLYTTNHFLFTDMLKITTYFDKKKKSRFLGKQVYQVLHFNEGCDGVGCGRKFPEGGNMCILMADAC